MTLVKDKNKSSIMKLFMIFFFLNFSNIVLSKVSFDCDIYSELENKEPARKNYENSQLELFLDLESKWLNDLPKNKWLENEIDNLDRIEINFLMENAVYTFLQEILYSSKKKVELFYQVTFNEKTGQMSFPKNYFNDEGEIFFSTEVIGFFVKKK